MLKFFNTYSRKKEPFKPIKKGLAGLYACGPTVYNFSHIGNLRTYIFEDILRRTIESAGYKIKHVMNITDIDDKIIRDSAKAKQSIFEFTKRYEKAFFEDLNKLNIKKAQKYPKATEHIKEMVGLIKILLQKKIAYIANDGVYFDISKFKKYGRLSKLHLAPRELSSRISVDEYDKSDAQDFALWKFARGNESSWPAPFGVGRPGWHIECSAMSMKYLGKTFDIHAGGVDLIFPHHENEIAQSEGATGKKFVNYFLEGEHLLVGGEKMSKSLGNVFTLRDFETKKINPLAFRYFVLGAHYRSKLNFTWEALEGAEKALEKLYAFIGRVKGQGSRVQTSPLPLAPYRSKFFSALSDDLNTSKALAVVWNLIHAYNKNPEKHDSKDVLKLFYELDEVLGLGFKKIKSLYPERSRRAILPAVLKLAQEREKFRKLKNWAEADRIREEIKKKGYIIDDTPKGPKLSPVSALLS